MSGSPSLPMSRIGKYAILSHIATGGMGTVYRARDEESGEVVALKVLAPELASNPVLVERFKREARHAAALADCGVRRVNVSIDTLDPGRFRAITRRGDLGQVLAGVTAARAAGLRVKINAVALRGVNDGEVHDLVAWCGDNGHDLTFIEVMPMGDLGNENRLDQYYSLRDLRADLERRWTLVDTPERTGGPARYVRVVETGGRVGFITPLTHNFCESCNRVRVTCTGQLYLCLGQEADADLRRPLRADPLDDAPLRAAIRAAIRLKPRGHDFDYSRQTVRGQVRRHMSHTGG